MKAKAAAKTAAILAYITGFRLFLRSIIHPISVSVSAFRLARKRCERVPVLPTIVFCLSFTCLAISSILVYHQSRLVTASVDSSIAVHYQAQLYRDQVAQLESKIRLLEDNNVQLQRAVWRLELQGDFVMVAVRRQNWDWTGSYQEVSGAYRQFKLNNSNNFAGAQQQ